MSLFICILILFCVVTLLHNNRADFKTISYMNWTCLQCAAYCLTISFRFGSNNISYLRFMIFECNCSPARIQPNFLMYIYSAERIYINPSIVIYISIFAQGQTEEKWKIEIFLIRPQQCLYIPLATFPFPFAIKLYEEKKHSFERNMKMFTHSRDWMKSGTE